MTVEAVLVQLAVALLVLCLATGVGWWGLWRGRSSVPGASRGGGPDDPPPSDSRQPPGLRGPRAGW